MTTPFRRYTGSLTQGPNRYLASLELQAAVNAALRAEQPLLVTGEPGVGKTRLAHAVAEELGLPPVLEFHTRSDHQARDVLYTFDTMRRFYDAQTGQPAAADPKNYRELAPLGEAIAAGVLRLVLIDEIDKAPRDFPNDLLDVFDRMRFRIPETGEEYPPANGSGAIRPVVIITSNSERQLPEPFLRRCVYHHIAAPDEATLRTILSLHLGAEVGFDALIDRAMRCFLDLRTRRDLEKPPSTAELIAWVRVLLREGFDPGALPSPDEIQKALPSAGVLVKTEGDLRRVAAR
jgi:MoxR-like ATPase